MKENLYSEAIQHFQKLYKRVRESKLVEPTAVTLATADKTGQPSARVVLLKSVDESGFVFYTNHTSNKGRQLHENPRAALCFYWDPLDYQIRVEGSVEVVSDAEADAYWATRPRQSQLGAWASLQSTEYEHRRQFLKRVADAAWKYKYHPVPRPSYWSGFRLLPNRIEFWKRKPFRLHERVVYIKSKTGWKKTLLYP